MLPAAVGERPAGRPWTDRTDRPERTPIMLLFMTPGDDGHSLKIDASKITAGTLHTATGVCAITYRDEHGVLRNQFVDGTDGPSVYAALNAIKAGIYSTTA
jgi:hypothetical protein